MNILPVEEQLQFVDLRRIRASLQAYRRGRFDRTDLRAVAGIEYLGSGCFGAAFRIVGTDLIVKFSGRAHAVDTLRHRKQEGTKHKKYGGLRYNAEVPEHDGWQLFAQEVMRNPHPNLPNILHFERIGASWAWAVMPYYDDDCWAKHPPLEEWRDALMGNPAALELYPFLVPFNQMREMMDLSVDLHSGNVRYDSRNQKFVIIDPFSDIKGQHALPEVSSFPLSA